MTTYPNKMSDEELREAIIGIVEAEYKSPNYTPAVERVDHIMQLIKQHREAYALEARLDELSICNDMCINASLGETYQVEEMIEERIAELQKRIKQDDTK